MKLLIVGSGKGSWEMRGRQLGAVLGATLSMAPTDAEIQAADVVVLVKRSGPVWAGHVRQFGKPIVWDALDFWQQPRDNGRGQAAALALLRTQLEFVRPALAIGATDAMAEAMRAEGYAAACLPHHGRLGLVPTPARETVKVVGYDGNDLYLGGWELAIQKACLRRGWTFAKNPADLSTVDLLVALRGGQWDGWICREWKSGVKLANAVLAGRPVITQPSAAWRELGPVGEAIVDPSEIDDAFETWTPLAARQTAVTEGEQRRAEFTVETMAERYRGLLASVEAACSA